MSDVKENYKGLMSDLSCLHTFMLFLCVTPVTDRRPIQCVPHLQPIICPYQTTLHLTIYSPKGSSIMQCQLSEPMQKVVRPRESEGVGVKVVEG